MTAVITAGGTIYVKKGKHAINVASYIGRDREASCKYGVLPWRSIQTTWYLEMFNQRRIRFRPGKTPCIMINDVAINFQRFENYAISCENLCKDSRRDSLRDSRGEAMFGKAGMIYLRRVWILGLFHDGKIVFEMNGALPDIFVNGKALNYALRPNVSDYGRVHFGEHWRIITNVWLQGIARIQKAISLVLTVKVEESIKFTTSNGHELEFPIASGDHITEYYDYLLDHLYDLSSNSGLYFAHRCHKIPKSDVSVSSMQRYTPDAIVLLGIVIPMVSREVYAFRQELFHTIIACSNIIPDISKIISKYVL